MEQQDRQAILEKLAVDHIEGAMARAEGLKYPAWSDYPGIDDLAKARDYTWLVAAERALEAHALLASPECQDVYREAIENVVAAGEAMKNLNATAAHEALAAALRSLKAPRSARTVN